MDAVAPDILDSQVHVYMRDVPRQPWRPGGVIEGPDEVTGDAMVTAMDELLIAGAVLVSYFGPYGYDVSYALRVADRFPERFKVVAPVDPTRADVAKVVEDLRREPSVVALRLLLLDDAAIRQAGDGRFDALFRAAHDQGLPVSLMTWETPLLSFLARRYPANVLVVDHLGLRQPHHTTEPKTGLDNLDHLLALAPSPNVYVKVSGVPTLSNEAFPFADIQPHVRRVLDAFGAQRCMWGSDWTRVAGMATYAESLAYLRDSAHFTEPEKQQLFGGTARKVYSWL